MPMITHVIVLQKLGRYTERTFPAAVDGHSVEQVVIELEAERCSLDSLGAFTDEHYCGPAVTRSMHSNDTHSQMWVGSDSEQSSSSYLFKSSQGSQTARTDKVSLLLLTSVAAL
jgi:hypothetical protein